MNDKWTDKRMVGVFVFKRAYSFFLMFFVAMSMGIIYQPLMAAAGQGANISAQSPSPAADCAMAVKLLKKQNHKLSRELGQIKREIAALRVAVHGVTPSKIFGGIGYILGLFGVAAMVAARKKND